MSIDKVDIDKCLGCGVCIASCNFGAISVKQNKRGYLIPCINNELCKNCGECEKKCQALSLDSYFKNNNNNCYCCQLSDFKKSENSSSGGAFIALSDCILNSGGIVFGAAFKPMTFELIHIAAQTEKEREPICGSKYLQSDACDAYVQVKTYLRQNIKVLFSGTPCQVEALYRYLNKDDISNLYTIDIICHGVPNNKVFYDYINILEEKHGKIIKYVFRDKSLGMKGSNVSVEFCSGEKIVNTIEVNSFDSLYSRGYLTRPSCYSCKYSSIKRVGDITIGDFWGIDNVFKNWDTSHGASLAMVNSSKGQALWNMAEKALYSEKVDISLCMQPSLIHPVNKQWDSSFFWNFYNKFGYKRTVKLFAKWGKISDIYQNVKYYVYRIIKL